MTRALLRTICFTGYFPDLTVWYLRESSCEENNQLPASLTLDREKRQRTEQKVFHQTKLEVFSLVRNLHVSSCIFDSSIRGYRSTSVLLFLASSSSSWVSPKLWILIACMDCIWAVINIISHHFVTNLQPIVWGLNAALYSFNREKSRQEFAIYLKGAKMRHQVLLQKVIPLRWSNRNKCAICWLMGNVLFFVYSINILLYIASCCLLHLTFFDIICVSLSS